MFMRDHSQGSLILITIYYSFYDYQAGFIQGSTRKFTLYNLYKSMFTHFAFTSLLKVSYVNLSDVMYLYFKIVEIIYITIKLKFSFMGQKVFHVLLHNIGYYRVKYY